jgi:hypothetical protein
MPGTVRGRRGQVTAQSSIASYAHFQKSAKTSGGCGDVIAR